MRDIYEELGQTNFAKLIKRGTDARDRVIFNAWADGNITTEIALVRFKRNNDIPSDYKIPTYEFVYWLGSLGYRRKAYCDRDED